MVVMDDMGERETPRAPAVAAGEAAREAAGVAAGAIAGERTDPKSLELLVCPLTKTTLEYDPVRQELISRRANLAYPIRSGVPLLTREAARNLDDKAG